MVKNTGRLTASRILDTPSSTASSDHNISRSTSPAPSVAPEDNVSIPERIAQLARSNPHLQSLLAKAAAGTASAAETREFQGYVDLVTQCFASNLSLSSSSSSFSSEAAATPTPVERKPTKDAACYTQPFLDFINDCPTVFHTVQYFETKLHKAGFVKLNERENWTTGDVKLEKGGRYFVSRNGSSIIAFVVGEKYQVGKNGVGMIAGHIDALTARLKPVSKKNGVEGYTMLGVAPYAGALNSTWWDRDLGIGGRVLVKQSNGKIATRLVRLDWPIARIPTLAPHFGTPSLGPFNKETQMVPVVGLEGSLKEQEALQKEFEERGGNKGTFVSTQPPKLVQLIAHELGVSDYSTIINWELELFDTQPGTVGGMNKEFIFAPRMDDKVTSWAALEGLVEAADLAGKGGSIALVALFDDEEIGSKLRQGAAGNFLPSTIERVVDTFAKEGEGRANLLLQTYANSFLVSADVTHAVNPNFLNVYLHDHMPRPNVGIAIAADSNGHMTTDSVSTAFLSEVAKRCDSELQVFQIRNDSRSGGTVGPMLSSALGCRAIDAGVPEISMHSIRSMVGANDPGLGVKLFRGFLELWEEVDAEFKE